MTNRSNISSIMGVNVGNINRVAGKTIGPITKFMNMNNPVPPPPDPIGNNLVSYWAEEEFTSGSIDNCALDKLTTNKAILACESSGGLAGCVLTANESDMSSGAVASWSVGSTDHHVIAALSSTKAIVAYDDINDHGPRVVIFNISGTTVSRGTIYSINPGSEFRNGDIIALSSTKALLVYRDHNSDGKAVVLDIDGNTITAGSFYTFEGSDTYEAMAAKVSSTKALIVWDEGYGKLEARVANISGTSISFGAVNTFEDGNSANWLSLKPLNSNGQFALAHARDENKVGVRVLTVTDNTVSAGSWVYTWDYGYENEITVLDYDTILDHNKVVVTFRDADPWVGMWELKMALFKISGTTVTYEDKVEVGDEGSPGIAAISVDRDKIVAAWRSAADGHGNMALVKVE